MIKGKIIDKKKLKNIVFLIVQSKETYSRLLIKKNKINNKDYEKLCIGDVIECEVVENSYKSHNFDFHGKTYDVKNIKIISHHTEELVFKPNIELISKYSRMKSKTREFLEENGYTEISIPPLTNDEISSTAESFKTYHNKTKIDFT